jgi:hypothetical protein
MQLYMTAVTVVFWYDTGYICRDEWYTHYRQIAGIERPTVTDDLIWLAIPRQFYLIRALNNNEGKQRVVHCCRVRIVVFNDV